MAVAGAGSKPCESDRQDPAVESAQGSVPRFDAIQRAGDISDTLRLAREAILANDRFRQDVEEQCALNITSIWEYID